MNSKLHALGDSQGRPIRLHLTAGQRSDFKGADVLLPDLTGATTLIADRGVTACIPPKKNRKEQIPYWEQTYKKRHKVENMFAKLKDWCRIATRYDGTPIHFSGTLTHQANQMQAAIRWACKRALSLTLLSPYSALTAGSERSRCWRWPNV